MKTSSKLVVVCAFVLTACDGVDRATAPSGYQPPAFPTPPTYVLSGIVRDQDDVPVGGAKVEIDFSDPRYALRTTTTDVTGFFSVQVLAGALQVRVGKDGYELYHEAFLVSGNSQIDVRLPRQTIQVEVLELGSTIHSITSQPPCDPWRWDERAPCRRFQFLAPKKGQLVVNLSFSGGSLDVTVVRVPTNDYVVTSEEALQGITVKANLSAGELYEIRVNSYYAPQAFDLYASFF